jgi:PAS domain S-box-containing protein
VTAALLLETVLANAPIGVAFLDLGLRYTHVNETLAQMAGRPASDYLGHTLEEVSPAMAPRISALMRRVLEEGIRIDEEVLAGDRRWASTFAPVRDGERVTGVVVLVTDVTDRRLIEEMATARVGLRAQVSEALARRTQGLAGAAEAFLKHLGVAVARIWLVDEGGEQLRLRASAGTQEDVEDVERAAPVPLGEGTIGRIAARRRPEILPGDDVAAGIVAFAGYPLVAGERLLGVLGLYARRPLPHELLTVLGDVTDLLGQGIERQRAEEALERSRHQLDVILQGISEGVTAQSPSGSLIYANDAAARMSGFATAREMMEAGAGSALAGFELRDDQGRPLPADELPGRRALRGESSDVILRVREKATGIERWTVVSARPVTDDGHISMAINVFRDITERKRSEESWRYLAEAGTTLSSSLDYEVTLGQVAKLAVPHIADWCTVEVLREEGQPAGERVQLAVAHVDPAKVALAHELRRRYPPDFTRTTSGVGKVLVTGKSDFIPVITDEMIDQIIPPGEQRDMMKALGLRSAMTVPLMVAKRAVGVMSFISAESGRVYQQSDLRLAEEVARRAGLAIENARLYRDAREAVRVREVFLSVASHELRTPLTTLLLQAESLQRAARRGAMPPDKVLGKATAIVGQLERLAALVDQLLDVSRVANGQLQLRREELDLSALAAETVARFQDDSAAPIRTEIAGPIIGMWDRLRVEQVLSNLLSNALKYGGGSPIDVTVSEAEGTATIKVTDRGIGIAPEHQGRIFERFERLVSERHYGGFGLGLWIVRQIVEALGGTITVASEPGKGSTFIVALRIRSSA